MLIFLLLMAMFGRGQARVSYGMEFITAFPENVGFLSPFNAQNSLNFTPLYSDTEVHVYFKGSLIYSTTLEEGETENYILPADVEEAEFTQSLKSVRIVSSKHIVAVSITEHGDSVQTNVLQPSNNLYWYYLIPSLNYTEILSAFHQESDNASKKYSFFRLIVINAQGVNNNITIARYNAYYYTYERFVLKPWALLQLPLNGSEYRVYGIYKLAVLVSHPCLKATKCKCNMVVNQLRSYIEGGLSFVVPSLDNMSYLHVTDYYYWASAAAAGNVEFVESTRYVKTNYSSFLRLIGPGQIIDVIPEKMFSACYQVHFSTTYGNVLVIAETVNRSQVHIDTDPLVSHSWSTVAGSNYSIVSVSLNSRRVIWHPTSKIGVYMFQRMASGTQYGGPAVPLSDKPDPTGCYFLPIEYTVGPSPMSWPESLQYCMSISAELISPTTVKAYKMLTGVLKKLTRQEYWIGLRRNLLTLEWFWYKGNRLIEVNYTQWNAGEPGDPGMGMCVSVLPNMTWNSLPCCTLLKPICYKPSEDEPE